MHSFEFTAEDLTRARFAVSPVHELVWSTVTLRKPRKAALHDHWREAASARLPEPVRHGRRFDLLFALTAGRTYLPDFMDPVPPRQFPGIAEQLSAVAGTDPDLAAAQVRRIGIDSSPLREFLARPRAELKRLADIMNDYFELVLAPYWPQLRGIAEAEITHRAGQAAAHGVATAIRDLHPRLRWDGQALHVDIGGSAEPVRGIRDLVLVPCCFAWPAVHPATEADPDVAIAYPPRGVGRLWRTGPGTRDDPNADLLGATRAAVLRLLEAAHTTGEIAQALDLSPATASHHLTVLRDAGLAVANRDGRAVRYSRTALGEALAG